MKYFIITTTLHNNNKDDNKLIGWHAYAHGMYFEEIRTNTNCVEDKIIRSMALKIGRALKHTNVRSTRYLDKLVGTILKTILEHFSTKYET